MAGGAGGGYTQGVRIPNTRILKSALVFGWLVFLGSLAGLVRSVWTLWRAFLFGRYAVGAAVPREQVGLNLLIFLTGALLAPASLSVLWMLRHVLSVARAAVPPREEPFRKAPEILKRPVKA